MRIPYGGTESHMLLVDCKSVKGRDGTPLMGDAAARILDLVGIVVNRNTIPGDSNALHASGIRLGTPWITQRGLREPEVELIAKAIADTLKTCQPYPGGAKVDFDVLEAVQAAGARVDRPSWACASRPPRAAIRTFGRSTIRTRQDRSRSKSSGDERSLFMQHATTNDLAELAAGGEQATFLLERDGRVMSPAVLHRPGEARDRYLLVVPGDKAARVAAWLRALSDGYVAFDDDLRAKLPGPVIVPRSEAALCAARPPCPSACEANPEAVDKTKPYFIGQHALGPAAALHATCPVFAWKEPPRRPAQAHDAVRDAQGRWARESSRSPDGKCRCGTRRSSKSTRRAARPPGCSTRRTWACSKSSGPDARCFLDLVQPNDMSTIQAGQSLYSYFLDVDGNCIDDTMIYHARAGRVHGRRQREQQ